MQPRKERRCLREGSGVGQCQDSESSPGPRPSPAHPPRSPWPLPGCPGPASAGAEWPSSSRDSPDRAPRWVQKVGEGPCPPAPPALRVLGAPLPGCGGMWSGLRAAACTKKESKLQIKRTDWHQGRLRSAGSSACACLPGVWGSIVGPAVPPPHARHCHQWGAEGAGRGELHGRPRSTAPAAGGWEVGLKGEGAMLRILLKQKGEQRVCTGAAPSLKDCNFLLWCLAGFATDINGNINSAWKVLNKTV